MPKMAQVVQKFGLIPGGRAQMYLGNRLKDLSDPYVPMESSALKNSARVVDGGTAITYNGPYARVHWYGYVMVGTSLPRVASTTMMKYRGAPMRGSKWVERAFNNNINSLIKELEKVIKKG